MLTKLSIAVLYQVPGTRLLLTKEVLAGDAVGRTGRADLERARRAAIGECRATSPSPEPTPRGAASPPGSHTDFAQPFDVVTVLSEQAAGWDTGSALPTGTPAQPCLGA
jgi:hypothetical protein